jgi:transcriptional regulator with XRE-family HTH domain
VRFRSEEPPLGGCNWVPKRWAYLFSTWVYAALDRFKAEDTCLLRIYYAMRHSPLRHPLAVLRQIIGLGQKELAQRVGKSTSTIQAIELGKLKLSEDLAAKIEEQTGVNSLWLLYGDPTNPIKNKSGARYRKDDYELARAKHSPLPEGTNQWPSVSAFTIAQGFAERIARVLAAADRLNPSMQNVASFRIKDCIEEMEKKFGKPPADYLEFRSRLKIILIHPDGSEWEMSRPVPPGAETLQYENFARSIREKYSKKDAADILANTPKPPKQKVKKSSRSKKKRS